MPRRRQLLIAFLLLFLADKTLLADSQVQVLQERNGNEAAGVEYRFPSIPQPSNSDAANRARVHVSPRLVDGYSATAYCLVDGKLPANQDDPSRNFFFRGQQSGRILIDLTKEVGVRQINTYSWHPRERGPQAYTLYAATGTLEASEANIVKSDSPLSDAWKKIARVDTGDKTASRGGQHAASVRRSDGGQLGRFRYLLFVVEPTRPGNPQSHTFFSEIDVIDGKQHKRRRDTVTSLQVKGGYTIAFDASESPELQGFIDARLKPACKEWLPKIVALLPSNGYSPPKEISVRFRANMDGVAYTAGTRIVCSANWFLRNQEGEATGALVHELVHAVQQYPRDRAGRRTPTWLVEGVADYIRWFLYEPARLRPRPNFRRANYNDSYRTSAAFLDFVVRQYDKTFITKVNAAMREGRYSTDKFWKEHTGKSPKALWDEYAQTAQQEPRQ